MKSYNLFMASQHPNPCGANVQSLTLMAKIDPMKVFCKFEVGGMCLNSACQDEHLRIVPLNKELALQSAESFVPVFTKLLPKSVVETTVRKSKAAIIRGENDVEKIVQKLVMELCDRVKMLPFSKLFPSFGRTLPTQ